MRYLPILAASVALALCLPSRERSLQTAAMIDDPTSELVFGGVPANLGDFPMQVFVETKKNTGEISQCGGSVISTSHVLTAGHCLMDVATVALVFGAVNPFSPDTVLRYGYMYNIHPQFSANETMDSMTIANDIAIVTFYPPVNLTNTNIQLAKIVKDDSELLKSPKAIVSGFGTYAYQGNVSLTSDDLLYTEVDLFSFAYCKHVLDTEEEFANLTIGNPLDHMLCAGAKDRGAGGGDSGGPLLVRHENELYQVGLTSFGSSNNTISEHHQDEVPGFFTRISSYCDFIEDGTNGDAKCGQVDEKKSTTTAA
ncbi:hypothetical protein QR680_010221 [Steinernema hermaphroditum]|uniref:Peptidase S1 domain-containing protein n=1 Tax=Steinernema hermaphroditum TaxID=289476 RepID=A0AA39MBC0_9BILA|nr:hypothetical protein QR680_010221 [Steinernema hermaphroditum]